MAQMEEVKAYKGPGPSPVDTSSRFPDDANAPSSFLLPGLESELAPLVEQEHIVDTDSYSLHPGPDKKKQQQLEKARSMRVVALRLVVATAVVAALGGLLIKTSKFLLSRKALPYHWSLIIPHESDWHLAGLDEAEQRLPDNLIQGKASIAAAAQRQSLRPLTEPERTIVEALAMHLSDGRTKNIEGLSLTLNNFQALGSKVEDTVPRQFTIRKYLGKGSTCVILEALDEATQQAYALRIRVLEKDSDIDIFAKVTARTMAHAAMLQETASMIAACGTTKIENADSERGIAMISEIARIEGIPSASLIASQYVVMNEVFLMERMCSDLLKIIFEDDPLPMNAKEYAAVRMVRAVLHLQSAGLSHNDIKPDNFLVRDDGTILVSDFGSSTPIGGRLVRTTEVSPLYCEPELYLELYSPTGRLTPPVVHDKCDMWSLGVSLYSVFMDGDYPYPINTVEPLYIQFMMMKRNANSANLEAPMADAGVPPRWRQLIMRLLEVEQKDRIGAKTLSEEYSDLVG